MDTARHLILCLLCFAGLQMHAQLPVRTEHPRLFLDSLNKARLLNEVAANNPDWLDLKADADDYATRPVLSWNPTNAGVWNTNFIFYNYCGSSWDEAAMTLGMAHQLTKGNNPGPNPTPYSDKLLEFTDSIIAAYQAYPPCSGCPNIFLYNSTYATRHVGPVVGIIYDWCHDELGAPRQAALMALIEDWFSYMRVPYQTYQNTVHPTGNYYFGHVLCAAYMGYATMHESADAQEMIDWARQRVLGTHSGALVANDLTENWMKQSYTGGLPTSASDSYLGPANYTSAPQMDGIPVQGWGYSGETFARLVDYLTFVETATGEKLRDSIVPFLENTSIAFAHALTPNRFQVDNSNDWGSFVGNFLSYGLPLKMAAITEGLPQGPFAQHFYQNWIQPVSIAAAWNHGYPAASYEKLLYANPARPSTAFNYPPYHPVPANHVMNTVTIDKGMAKYYLRENWSDTATWCALNMSCAYYDDHDHHNAGHFQILRGDSVDGDDLLLVGANEIGNGGQFGLNGIEGGTCYHFTSSLSNTLFFDDYHDYTETNTNGYTVGGQSFFGSDEPTHQEQNDDFSYIRADLSSAYYRKGELADTVNRTLLYFHRGFLYLRDADIFLVYDRFKARTSNNPAGAYRKHLRWHFLENPTINGNNITATKGNSKLHVHTVLPATVTITAVDESNNPDNTFGPNLNYAFNTYSWRAEVFETGNPQKQDILTVMQPTSTSHAEMLTTAIMSNPGDMEGSLVALNGVQELVLFNRDSSKHPAPINTTNYAFAWHPATMHTLVGMVPGAAYQVDYNGALVSVSLSPSGNHTASPSGVLRFALTLPTSTAQGNDQPIDFNVWPNPSTGRFQCAWTSNANPIKAINVFDAAGKLILNLQPLSAEVEASISLPKAGMYFLQARDSKGNSVHKKLLVEH